MSQIPKELLYLLLYKTTPKLSTTEQYFILLLLLLTVVWAGIIWAVLLLVWPVAPG